MRVLLLLLAGAGVSMAAFSVTSLRVPQRPRRSSSAHAPKPALLALVRGGGMDFQGDEEEEKVVEEDKAWQEEENELESEESEQMFSEDLKEDEFVEDSKDRTEDAPSDEKIEHGLTLPEAFDAYLYQTPLRPLATFFVFATLVNTVVELRVLRQKAKPTGAFRRAILAGSVGFGAELLRRTMQIVLETDDEDEQDLPPWRRDFQDELTRQRDDIKLLAKEPVTFAFAFCLILSVLSTTVPTPASAVIVLLVLSGFRLGSEALEFYEQVDERPFNIPLRPSDLDLAGLLGAVPFDALFLLNSVARAIRNPTNLRNVIFAVLLGNYGYAKWKCFSPIAKHEESEKDDEDEI